MSLAPPAVTSNVVAQPCIPDAVRQPSVGPGLREDFVGVLESVLWTLVTHASDQAKTSDFPTPENGSHKTPKEEMYKLSPGCLSLAQRLQ